MENLIINNSDERFSLINELYLKYNFNNLLYQESSFSMFYFIPPELVINEWYGRFDSKVVKNPLSNSWDNWVFKSVINKRLKYCCNLNSQDYFDLLILHINDRLDRPKCRYCGDYLNWTGYINSGYGNGGKWNYYNSLYCSNSCHISHQIDTTDFKVRMEFKHFLNKGNLNDPCYLYLFCLDNYKLKFGITRNLYERKLLCSREGFEEISELLIYKGSRLQVANIEVLIKLHYNKIDEYFDYSEELVNELLFVINSLIPSADNIVFEDLVN